MPISINSNIPGLKAQRQLDVASGRLATTYERLSSGQRINRASDDAAGVAIASSLGAQTRIYTQAVRNANDGISLLNIRDGGLAQLSSILDRMTELSEQAANGTYSNTQRRALDVEVQALKLEWSRIIDTTTFNGKNLLSTSSERTTIQVGIGSPETIQLSAVGISQSFDTSTTVGAGNGTFQAVVSIAGINSTNNDNAVSGDLDGDGDLDLVFGSSFGVEQMGIRLNNGDGTFAAPTSFGGGQVAAGTHIQLGDLNGDGRLDLVSLEGGGPGWVNVAMGTGTGTFGAFSFYTAGGDPSASVLIDVDGDNDLDIATTDEDDNALSIYKNNGNGTFQARVSIVVGSNLERLAAGDIDGDNDKDLVVTSAGTDEVLVFTNNGSGSYSLHNSFAAADMSPGIGDLIYAGVTLGDFTGDNILDIAVSDWQNDTMKVWRGSGSGTFSIQATLSAGQSPTAVTSTDLDRDGDLDIVSVARDHNVIDVFLGNGNGTFAARRSYASGTDINYLSIADLNGDGGLDIFGSNTGPDTLFYLRANTTQVSATAGVDIRTQANARSAPDLFLSSQQTISRARSSVGADLSRLEVTTNVLLTRREGLTSARSRILDADIAAEAATLASTQIVQQAAAQVLSASRLQPELALTLLRP